jgi:DNA-binding NarL/FixJ family response regulator
MTTSPTEFASSEKLDSAIKPIRVLVADDHYVARAGVAAMVAGTEIEVSCEAVNGEQAVRYATSSEPDVILLDVRLPDGPGFVALQQIKSQRPGASVLMFSASEELHDIAQAREMGACGYLTKNIKREDLIQAIRRAAEGKESWTRQQLRRVNSTPASKTPLTGADSVLTRREREVLQKLTEGLANEQIAEQLDVDVETIKHHVKHILAKLGLVDRTQAAIWAVRNGLA